jgi:16S rRNA (uracil1498-N3)-methyltransferase
MGVGKITFITCAYSQKNFKPSLERMEKILINSCEQCGRSELMAIDFCDSVKAFLESNPGCAILTSADFGGREREFANPRQPARAGTLGGGSRGPTSGCQGVRGRGPQLAL